MILPRVVMSGQIPSFPCTPEGEMRNPVMTSSKMSNAPSRAVMSRRYCRKPGLGR